MIVLPTSGGGKTSEKCKLKFNKKQTPTGWLKLRNPKLCVVDDVQQLKFSYFSDGSLKWSNYYGILINVFKAKYVYVQWLKISLSE